MTKLTESILAYKLAILRGVLYSLMTLVTSFLAAVTCVDFPTLSTWNKFLLILGVFATWMTTVLAFLDKTLAKISPQQPQPPASPASPQTKV